MVSDVERSNRLQVVIDVETRVKKSGDAETVNGNVTGSTGISGDLEYAGKALELLSNFKEK